MLLCGRTQNQPKWFLVAFPSKNLKCYWSEDAPDITLTLKKKLSQHGCQIF